MSPALIALLLKYLPELIAILIGVLKKKDTLTDEEAVHLEKLTQLKELLEK